MRLGPIMFVGTGSDVGKSVVTAAFCRIFLQDGYSPAPFKAQNMALNSYVTPDGLEIGRAQEVQAAACGIAPHTDMNPILLKPCGNNISQVVLNGKPYGNSDAYSYFRGEGRDLFVKEVRDAYDRLATKYQLVVLEGAGSISELNLKANDIVNMSMALYAKASVILIADIERGGVFASLYGSIMLLDQEERSLIKGIIINKFRGDIRLFDSAKKMIEDLCGVPVLGIIPYFKDIYIEEEDSVAISKRGNCFIENRVNIVVVYLNQMSNYTDFAVLERDSRVNLYYSKDPSEIKKAQIIIIPGTKSTLSDLHYIRANGIASAILDAHKSGSTIIGICGGYQIMGEEILDLESVEGDITHMPGLSLLPLRTYMTHDKITNESEFILNSEFINHQLSGVNGDYTLDSFNVNMRGYEIHMGRSEYTCLNPKYLLIKPDGTRDGCWSEDRLFGTYMHGIFDNSKFIDLIIAPYSNLFKDEQYNLKFDPYHFREDQFDKLAKLFRESVDLEKVYKIIKH